MKKAIDQDTFAALVQTSAVRDFRATRRGEKWQLEARLGAFWLTYTLQA